MTVQDKLQDFTPEHGEPLLEINSLSKSFGSTHALKSVSIKIREGSIHCLLGENGAGKSTIGKILGGLYTADAGSIFMRGSPVAIKSVTDARSLGIAIVFQELSLAPDLTVLENICLGTERHIGFADRKRERRRCAQTLAALDSDISLNARTGSLPVAQQQLIEIAKAMQANPRLIILDEPTAMLGAVEQRKLFSTIRRLRDQGTTFILVTHHLDEVIELADDVSILRDGALVDSFALEGRFDSDAILEKISGRRASQSTVETGDPGEAILNITMTYPDGLEHCIDVHAGEIVGLYGVVGCGREDIIAAVAGIKPLRNASMHLSGKPYRPGQTADAARSGVGYLPTGRAANGIFPSRSIRENLTISQLGRFSRFGFINKNAERQASTEQLRSLKTRMASSEDAITSLSGGNQQKVLLGRCLARSEKLIILEDPTAGIDIGAKQEIHDLIRKRVAEGAAALFVSSDIRETLALCTTVYTIFDGRVIGRYGSPLAEHEGDIVGDVLGNGSHFSPLPTTLSSGVRRV